ncbi:MAG TPA: NEW3 domain-containing protein, partial [Longimicrobiales bacterium]
LVDRAAAALAGRDGDAATELRFHVEAERADVRAALALAAGVVVGAVADEELITPGQRFGIELSVWNGGARPVSIRALEPVLPEGWRAEPDAPLPAEPLAPGTMATRRFTVSVPGDAPATEPYYLRRPRDGDLYRWPADPRLRGLPFQPPTVRALARVAVADVEIPIEREVQYLTAIPTLGEVHRPVRVVPAVSVALEPTVAVLPLNGGVAAMATNGKKASTDTGLDFSVELVAEAPDGVTGTLALELPAGWRAEPESRILRFTGPGERRQVTFRVFPPADATAGTHQVRAVFQTANGRRYDRGYQLIDYPHIRPRPLYSDAVSTVRTFDVRVAPGLRVAYVPGAGDRVPQALAQLGVRPDIIEPADLAAADLDAYDVVVLGIRAYEHRPELRTQNRRLLDYVERGGTLIVQYNQYTFSEGDYAPYPLEIARPHDRVTDETAPVRILDPSHPAVSWPNRITDADFEGWVQERGLYFPHTWDAHYQPLLEMSDPGEEPLRGALLVAPYGEGTYVYTGIAFFRQLPAGVPGAYRLFANLLSLGAER